MVGVGETMGKLLTYKEAAMALRISRRTLDKLVADKEIECFKVGGKLLVEEREIEKLLRRSKVS